MYDEQHFIKHNIIMMMENHRHYDNNDDVAPILMSDKSIKEKFSVCYRFFSCRAAGNLLLFIWYRIKLRLNIEFC